MQNKDFERVGKTLYGNGWKSPLAAGLGISRGRLNRLFAEPDADTPLGLVLAIEALKMRKREELA